MTNTMTRFDFVGQLARRFALPLAVLALAASTASAQAPAKNAKKAEPDGYNFLSKYNIHQSIELGGRFVSVNGSGAMWDTISNVQQGPRILGQSLEMRALDPKKTLFFDNLSTASYGYGGDPTDYTFLRFSKGKAYEFSGSFRRDRNYFNDNVLANPLIPNYAGSGSGSANQIVGYTPMLFSPHAFNTVRRMTDADVTILPLAKISYRAGFSHSTNEGPSYSTIHSSFVDMLLNQWWRNSTDTYRAGVDVKIAPKTVLSYDEIYVAYKGDTSYSLAGLNNTLQNGVPVSLGIEFFPATATAAAPTATGFSSTSPTLTTPACGTTPYTGTKAVPLTCTALAFSDKRFSPTRNAFPTEQLRLTSMLIPHVTFNARAYYRSTTVGAVNDYYDLQTGFKSSGTAGASTYTSTGTAYATDALLYTGSLGSNNRLATTKRIDQGGDAGFTVQISRAVSATDNYVYSDWREEGAASLLTNTAYGPNDGTIVSQNYAPAGNAVFGALGGTPFHNAGTGADSSNSAYLSGFAQKSQQNTVLVAIEATPWLKWSVGYKVRNRQITGSGDYNEYLYGASTVATYVTPFYNATAKGSTCIKNGAGTQCTVTTAGTYGTEVHNYNENWGLIGITLQPTAKLHANIDYAFMSADGILTPINNRRFQEIKFRGNYRPTAWLNLAFSGHDSEGQNSVPYVNHRDHSADYSGGADITVNEKLSVSLNYAYDDTFASTGTCYISTATLPAGTTTTAPPCTSGTPNFSTGYYDAPSHFGSASIHFAPVKRVDGNVGYRITDIEGRAEELNPRMVPGSLFSHFQEPFMDFAVKIAPQWSYKFAWKYTGYGELGGARGGLLGDRSVHGNQETLSVNYAF